MEKQAKVPGNSIAEVRGRLGFHPMQRVGGESGRNGAESPTPDPRHRSMSCYYMRLVVMMWVVWLAASGGASGQPVESLAALGSDAPLITAQPWDMSVARGQMAYFSVTATKAGPLSYQWRKDGVDIPGATGAAYLFRATDVAQAAAYSVVVRNDAGGAAISSPATLTVKERPAPGAVVAWGGDNHVVFRSPQAFLMGGALAVAAGRWHALALKEGGSVTAWGFNDDGQTNVPPRAREGVVEIAAGFNHSLALKEDGSVVAWGYDLFGQSSVPVGALSGVVKIAAGANLSAAIKSDGSVVLWGDTRNHFRNTPPDAFTGLVDLAVGVFHFVALKADGTLRVWGDNSMGQLKIPAGSRSNVVAVAAKLNHTLALTRDGSVVAWGDNSKGQVQVPAAASGDMVGIAAGEYHCVGLRADGSMIVWGGLSRFETTIPATAQGDVLSVAAGDSFSLALVAIKPPLLSSQPVSRERGVGDLAIFRVTVVSPAALYYQWRKDGVDIVGATNEFYSFKVTETRQEGAFMVAVSNSAGSVTSAPPAELSIRTPGSGGVVAWGLNDHGQTAVPREAQSGIIAVAGGWGHSVALGQDGKVIAWGANERGQTNVPAGLGDVVSIAAGDSHTLALKTDGSVMAWGSNEFGQSTVPAEAADGVSGIAAGTGFSLALKNDGTVVAWGDNRGGQTAVPEYARTGMVSIAAGDGHGVALRADGFASTWGDSFRTYFVPSAARVDVTAITAGGNRALALTADGQVVAWGDNSPGQKMVPAAATNGVIAIAAGGAHSLALREDGTIVAWGTNQFGQTSVPAEASAGVVGIAAGHNHSLAITPLPVISRHPASATVHFGEMVGFEVIARGGGRLGYQWVKDGANLAGATNSTLNFSVTQESQLGVYSVRVSNEFGSVTSREARLSAVASTAPSVVFGTIGDDGMFELSWPGDVTGFVLQSTVSLSPPVTWIDLANPSAQAGGKFTLTNTVDGPARFYRLLKP